MSADIIPLQQQDAAHEEAAMADPSNRKAVIVMLAMAGIISSALAQRMIAEEGLVHA